MASKSIYRVVIQHVTGAKANQIEQFPLGEKTELRLGRDPASDITFDPVRDDVVSRNHATIKIGEGEQVSFRLLDNNSSNGTFLNGERLSGEKELLPQDTISLGANGPNLIFDVQPRPANLGVRTHVIDLQSEAATRTVDLAATATPAAPISTNAWTAAAPGADTTRAPTGADTRSTAGADTRSTSPPPPPPRSGIGKETLMREIQHERSKTTKVWAMTLAGFAIVAIGIGALLYWREIRSQQAELARDEDLSRRNERDVEATESTLRGRIGVSAQQIVQDYGNATARLKVQWRLYDQQTGKPVFHRTSVNKDAKGKDELRDYVRGVTDSGETKVVPWLTIDEGLRTNRPIMKDSGGTAFVVDEHGYLLTSKHLAEGWTVPFYDQNDSDHEGWLWEYQAKLKPKGLKAKPKRIDLNAPEYAEAKRWAPTDGGYVFAPNDPITWGLGSAPDASKINKRDFAGRNDIFEVQFPDTIASVRASLVRTSEETDAALLKIDAPQKLKAVVLAPEPAKDDPAIVSVGATVFVLGYPAIAEKTLVHKEEVQTAGVKKHDYDVPKPFITEGIVSLVAPRLTSENLVTTSGQYGELLQLSINSTGAGNSGGPVFNSQGKVIGVFTTRFSGGGATNSGAVPIRFGQELLRFQRE